MRATFVAVMAGLVGYSCSSGKTDSARPPPVLATGGAASDGGASTGGKSTAGTTTSTTNDVATGACTVGDARACRYVIGIYDGQESCFVGMQYCDTGVWTGCTDPRDAG